MNPNTFARHGVFEERGLGRLIAAGLCGPHEIQRARVFPYQLLTPCQNCDAAVPEEVWNALQNAMELATVNVPPITGEVLVYPDVSGSMTGPVTGYRNGSATSLRRIDIAALAAAAVLRKNPEHDGMPFEHADLVILPNQTTGGRADRYAEGSQRRAAASAWAVSP